MLVDVCRFPLMNLTHYTIIPTDTISCRLYWICLFIFGCQEEF